MILSQPTQPAYLMGFKPGRVSHIREGSRFLGNASSRLLDQAGELLTAPTIPFQVVPEFQHLHDGSMH